MFEERLWVPWWWWLLGALVVALLGAEIHVGLGWGVAVATYVVLGGLGAVLLLRWGSARIAVTAAELVVRRDRLPLAHVTDVRVLTKRDTRAVLAQHAGDPAVLHLRGYAPGLVYVATDAAPERAAFWLVSSRRPGALASALDADRREETRR